MSQTPASSRDRMIATAAELIRAQGFHATGLNQIVAEAHAPKGSLYHHFPGGKEELAAAAIEHYGGLVHSLLEHCLEQDDPADAVDAFVGALAHQLERSDFHAGCPVGVTAMEAGAASDRLAEVTRAAFDGWTAAIEARLRADATPEPHDRAILVVAAMEGALMLARAHRSTEPLLAVKRSLTTLLRTPT